MDARAVGLRTTGPRQSTRANVVGPRRVLSQHVVCDGARSGVSASRLTPTDHMPCLYLRKVGVVSRHIWNAFKVPKRASSLDESKRVSKGCPRHPRGTLNASGGVGRRSWCIALLCATSRAASLAWRLVSKDTVNTLLAMVYILHALALEYTTFIPTTTHNGV